jgi:hypothetical protein
MPDEIKDKNGEPIKEGDEVSTKIRGGTHTGTVEKVVTTKEEAEQEGVKNPPKASLLMADSGREANVLTLSQVLYTDQHGHNVNHNPGTLQHTE